MSGLRTDWNTLSSVRKPKKRQSWWSQYNRNNEALVDPENPEDQVETVVDNDLNKEKYSKLSD